MAWLHLEFPYRVGACRRITVHRYVMDGSLDTRTQRGLGPARNGNRDAADRRVGLHIAISELGQGRLRHPPSLHPPAVRPTIGGREIIDDIRRAPRGATFDNHRTIGSRSFKGECERRHRLEHSDHHAGVGLDCGQQRGGV